MSRSVLISIRPKWCELIASGKKTVEVRKTRPSLKPPFKCYMYMCAYSWSFDLLQQLEMDDLVDRLMNAYGKVIGEFICDCCDVHPPWEDHLKFLSNVGCIPYSDLVNYSGGKRIFAWHISNLVIYSEPKALIDIHGDCSRCGFVNARDGNCDFIVRRPPQSWCYVRCSE